MKEHKSAGIKKEKCGLIYKKEFCFDAGVLGCV